MGGNSEVVGTDELENGRFSSGSEPTSSIRMGHVVSEQNCGNSERGDRAYQSQSDRNAGMVQGGVGASVEAHLSLNPNKHQIRKPCIGPSCLEPHTQPVVEVPHGCSSSLDGGIGGVKQAAETFNHAPLGQDRVDCTKKEASGFQGNGNGSLGESSHLEINPVNGHNSVVRCASEKQGGHLGYSEAYDGVEAGLGGFQGLTEKDGMEYGGDSHDEL